MKFLKITLIATTLLGVVLAGIYFLSGDSVSSEEEHIVKKEEVQKAKEAKDAMYNKLLKLSKDTDFKQVSNNWSTGEKYEVFLKNNGYFDSSDMGKRLRMMAAIGYDMGRNKDFCNKLKYYKEGFEGVSLTDKQKSELWIELLGNPNFKDKLTRLPQDKAIELEWKNCFGEK